MASIVLIAVLATVLVVFGVGLLWQERRSRGDDVAIYGVEESIEYVWERLDDRFRDQATVSDVRRVLGWEMHYLQQPRVREGRTAVVGGVDVAGYVQDRAFEEGHSYEPGLIFAVLDLEAAYLSDLGAVGPPAAADDGGPG